MWTAVEPLGFENCGWFLRVLFRPFLSSFFGYLQAQPLLNLYSATSDLQITPPFLFILLLTLTHSLYHGFRWLLFLNFSLCAFSDCSFYIFFFSPCIFLLPLHSWVFWSTDFSLPEGQLTFLSPTKYLLLTTLFWKCYWVLFFI